MAADRSPQYAIGHVPAGRSGRDCAKSNPVIGTNKASDDKPRERVLSDAELIAVWKAVPDNDYGKIVRLLMLTGQRRLEIGGLRWPGDPRRRGNRR